MELGLGFALAEATWRESESVQCRRGEELASNPLIHPRTILGRSTAREGGGRLRSGSLQPEGRETTGWFCS